MFQSKHYVPAIKWRQGEYLALAELSDAQRDRITPLVEIPPVPWDFDEEQPAKSVDQHLARVPAQMAEHWGERPVFVDTGLLDGEARMANARHPIDDLFERLAVVNVPAIPVLSAEHDAAYQQAVAAVVARDNRGVAIRLRPDDFANPNSAIAYMAELVDAPDDEIDLILDLGSIQPAQVQLVQALAANAINSITNIGAYRTLTLLSGAFPVNLSEIAPGFALLPRSDWALWVAVRNAAPVRQPSYGDYTAAHPEQQDGIDPRLMQTSASIRYAADNDWVIARGRSLRSPRFGGSAQYNTLCQQLVRHPLFTGGSFSWASDFIEQCANNGPRGNPATWRKVATNRHVVWTANQIANLP